MDIIVRIMKIFFKLLLMSLLFFGMQPLFATIYTVTNASASGPGSLLDQVAAANLNAGPDEIRFNIPGSGPHVIQLSFSTNEIDITEALLINGLSQPGASGPSNLVALDLNSYNGFIIQSSNVEISGLKFFNGYLSSAVKILFTTEGYSYRDISIHDNLFDGGVAFSVRFSSGSCRNIAFFDNVIEGSSNYRTRVMDVEVGSAIGYPAPTLDSLLFLGNTINSGVYEISGPRLRVSGAGNVPTATHFLVEDNVFNCTGTMDAMVAVTLEAGTNTSTKGSMSDISIKRNIVYGGAGFSEYGVYARTTALGGGTGIIENLDIRYNEFYDTYVGIQLESGGGNANASKINNVTITGNTITDSEFSGIYLACYSTGLAMEMQHFLIDSNEVSGSWNNGLLLQFEDAAGGSGSGTSQYQDVQILKNHIHDSGIAGIDVLNSNAAYSMLVPSIYGLLMSENSIHDNQAEGIAIDGSGTMCDLPVPVITSVTGTSVPYTVNGTLTGEPNTSYKIEFFTNAAPDGSGYGEGEVYVANTTIALDGAGNGSFNYAVPSADLNARYVATTATNLTTLNTGCFSNADHATATAISEGANAQIKLYPNPTSSGLLSISYPGELTELKLCAIDGRSAKINQIDASNLDISANIGGVYLLEITTSEGHFVKKIIHLPWRK